MHKKMKLATKMALGFGSLVLIAAVLGGTGWSAIRTLRQNVQTLYEANTGADLINSCAVLRRDFSLNGFEKAEGETKNAPEKWGDAYASLNDQLKALVSNQSTSVQCRDLATSAAGSAANYKTAFDHLVEVQQIKDKAFADWTKAGGEITRSIEEILAKVINPAVATATTAKDIESMLKWFKIEDMLKEQIIEPYFLLRIEANKLARTGKDAEWTSYQQILKRVKAGIPEWAVLAKGNGDLEKVATDLEKYCKEYENFGQQYYEGIVASRKSSAELGATAKEVVSGIQKMAETIRAMSRPRQAG